MLTTQSYTVLCRRVENLFSWMLLVAQAGAPEGGLGGSGGVRFWHVGDMIRNVITHEHRNDVSTTVLDTQEFLRRFFYTPRQQCPARQRHSDWDERGRCGWSFAVSWSTSGTSSGGAVHWASFRRAGSSRNEQQQFAHLRWSKPTVFAISRIRKWERSGFASGVDMDPVE